MRSGQSNSPWAPKLEGTCILRHADLTRILFTCSSAQMYSERKRFRGVSRSPWSLTWDSHVPITASSKEVVATANVCQCTTCNSPICTADLGASQQCQPEGRSIAQWLFNSHGVPSLPAPEALAKPVPRLQCGVQEREVFLGSFSTENTAAKAHDVAALRLQADHASGQQVQIPCGT